MNKDPFFIVGCPRSGTTLLQTSIDAHPDIAIPPESHVFSRFGPVLASYGDLTQRENLSAYVSDLLNDERIKLWDMNVTVDKCLSELDELSLSAALNWLFGQYTNREGKKRWGDKTPDHALWLNEIDQVFSNAKFIHFIRDGRDVAESLSRVYFGPTTIDKCAELWKRYMESFNAFKSKISKERYLEVHFEDLISSPDETVSKILTFLGEANMHVTGEVQDTARRDFYLKKYGNLHSSLGQPFSSKKVGVFKKRFSDREIEIFESIAGDMLKQYGYERLYDSPEEMNSVEKLKYCIINTVVGTFRKLSRLHHVRERIHYRWRNLVRGAKRS